jgi:two-component system chemotaxis response regulator CheB
MDIEMPVMDGITACRIIMKECPTPVLMFSTLTTSGARATLDALDAGAVDFLPKSLTDISEDKEVAKRQLCARVRAIGARGLGKSLLSDIPSDANKRAAQKGLIKDSVGIAADYDLIIIGTSTGGPQAIQKIITSIPEGYSHPIVIIQHMPESFTGPFAERLNSICKVNVLLANNADVIKSGYIYLAPGGHQLTFSVNINGQPSLQVNRSDESLTYKPCVDVTFKSAAEQFHGKIMAIVMTGMGSDGKEGARVLKSKGATIVAQDQESSTVYGMPMAIEKAGLADMQLSLNEIAGLISGS